MGRLVFLRKHDASLKMPWGLFLYKIWTYFTKTITLVQVSVLIKDVVTPLWAKCDNETHKPNNGNLESSGTLENLELNSRGQNTLYWDFLCNIEKFLKCRCRKWPRMSHLDICNTSYSQNKGREFDSRPLKVGNRPESNVSRWSVTRYWKALKESYKIASDLIPIRSLSKKLWMPKVLRVQTGTVSGPHFGSPGKKWHSDVGAAE
jgi:hypothetical protein